MALKNVTPIKGAIFKGDLQTERERRSSQWYKSDAIGISGDTAQNLFRLPPNTLVVGGFVRVDTAFDASGTSTAATVTLTITNDTGTETIFDAANVALQSTGFKPCTNAALVPADGGMAAISFDPATSAGGSFRVYLEVVELNELL